MNRVLRSDAERIVREAISAVMPEAAVRTALAGRTFPGRVIVVAAGKAAWRMASAAMECTPVDGGIVITKYGHVFGALAPLVCREAGHPVPDGNSFSATAEALSMVSGLQASDTVLLLLSGGGSALFEMPKVSPDELRDVTGQLLRSGADIVEMNTVRKRLSEVKGGQFALRCAPAQVVSVILSDIVGDPVDMIASGPACADSTTCAQALAVVRKYALHLSDAAMECLRQETPKVLYNVETRITGSVRALCAAAMRQSAALGYEPILLTDSLCIQAREAGAWLARELLRYRGCGRSVALIAGGETVVEVRGDGLGGRNQELALAAAPILEGAANAAVISVGSDGTDGPTDAAGGYADGDTTGELTCAGWSVSGALLRNDAYHALQSVGGLIITGPTGTNVNDVAVALLKE